MASQTTLQIFALVLVALLVAIYLLVSILLKRVDAEQLRSRLLRTALASVSGVCYRVDIDRAVRVDGWDDDERWPLNLNMVLASLREDTRAAIEARINGLHVNGSAFFLQVAIPTTGRTLEFTGHRMHAPKEPFVDLVWAADVTEKATAAAEHERLGGEVDLLHTLVDCLPIAVWWRGRNLDVVGSNGRFRRIGGVAAAARPLAVSAQEHDLPAHGSHHVVSPAGTQIFDVVELPREDGGTVGYAIDKSDLQQLRQEMERIALGHHQVLEALGTAIAIWGADTRLLFSNTAFHHLWGLDPGWLATEPGLGEVLDALRNKRLLPEYADFRAFKNEQLDLFGAVAERRTELLHLPDERTLRLTIARHPFGGLIFSYDDVSDSLALERSYNTLTAVQRETLDNLSEGVAVFGSDGRMKLWNPVYAALWHLSPAELGTRPHVTAVVERARPFFDAVEWDDIRRSTVERVTTETGAARRLERKDGMILELNAVPLPDGNVLLSYLDVSDTVRVQKALQERNEALEEAARLKSEFLANVSYELRTPLNAIAGFAEILSNQYFGAMNTRQLEYSAGILDSSQRLLALINDILDLATVEAGQLVLQREPIDVHGLLGSIMALSRDRADELGLALVFDCADDIGPIMIDERRLRQAMFNLVSNAIKFTPAGGKVTIGACRRGNEIGITVADTGVGIDPAVLPKVFEKFERGSSGRRGVGAGLGLSLVKSFVEMHGGRVEIESAPQRGTTVTSWLPAMQAVPAIAVEPRRRIASPRRAANRTAV